MFGKTGIFAIVFLVFAVPPLAAQGFHIGPQAGFHKTADADGNILFGAAARLKLSPAIGVEGSINYRQEDFSNTLTVRSWPVMVTGMLYPLPIVYGAVGAGWYNTTFDFDDNAGVKLDETNQEFGWHFGAGAELPMGKAKLTGDVRYVFVDYNFDEIPFQQVDSNFYVITVGFLFGL